MLKQLRQGTMNTWKKGQSEWKQVISGSKEERKEGSRKFAILGWIGKGGRKNAHTDHLLGKKRTRRGIRNGANQASASDTQQRNREKSTRESTRKKRQPFQSLLCERRDTGLIKILAVRSERRPSRSPKGKDTVRYI